MPLVEATTLSHLGTSISGYGRIRLWGSIGFIVAVVAIGYYLDHAVIAHLLWIVLMALIGIAVFAQQIPEVSLGKHEAAREPIIKILRQRNVIILFLGCFLMSAAHGPYYTFYSIYLVEHGYAKSDVGWLWALGVICEVAVFIWMSQLMKRFSSYQILIVSFALAVVRFLLIAWGVDSLVLMLFAQTLHAATFGAYHAAAVALIHQLFPGHNQAKGQALYTSLSFGAGGTFGGLISGYLWEHAGAAMTFSFSAMLAAGAWVAMSIWFKPVLQNK